MTIYEATQVDRDTAGVKGGDYPEKIRKEGVFWSNFELEANRFGIPWWCDLRRATKLSKPVGGWMHDPVIEAIMRGRLKNRLIEIASGRKGRVLDLGCGAGWLSLELARMGMDVDGYDISPERIRLARRYAEENPFRSGFGSVCYELQDINNIVLAEERYDAVVIWDTLHHIPDVEALMEKVGKALKKDGVLVLYDHIGLEEKNRALIRFLDIPFRIYRAIRKLVKRDRVEADRCPPSSAAAEAGASPFEDVTGHAMIDAVKKLFVITVFKTQLSFLSAYVDHFLGLPGKLKYAAVSMLKYLDDLLIAMRLLNGEYVFVVAKKHL